MDIFKIWSIKVWFLAYFLCTSQGVFIANIKVKKEFLLGELGLNLALSLVTSCCSCQTAWWRPAAVGWGEGPWALVTPVKAIRVGVGLFKKNIECFSGIQTQIAGIKGNHADHLTTTTTLIWAVFKLLNSLWEYFCFKITLFSHFWARWLIRTNYFPFF